MAFCWVDLKAGDIGVSPDPKDRSHTNKVKPKPVWLWGGWGVKGQVIS
jgi:hypothetical protein